MVGNKTLQVCLSKKSTREQALAVNPTTDLAFMKEAKKWLSFVMSNDARLGEKCFWALQCLPLFELWQCVAKKDVYNSWWNDDKTFHPYVQNMMTQQEVDGLLKWHQKTCMHGQIVSSNMQNGVKFAPNSRLADWFQRGQIPVCGGAWYNKKRNMRIGLDLTARRWNQMTRATYNTLGS